MNVLKPHISLNVTAIDRSVEFYEKAFGVPATKRRPGYAGPALRPARLQITSNRLRSSRLVFSQDSPRVGPWMAPPIRFGRSGVRMATVVGNGSRSAHPV